ncbi:Poly(A) RNA polymerase D5 non-canonical [Paragonimus heterotremus]|uniref:polynucleotide adenylyltransferase n=1 Tax=Paragonimus heterotremus TaxID=100268 RepID=A0A8J4SUH6_9TREM|nr:Poly(A) RNA polymerase D5 non-canonical [Paragonimus heterotremus]
MTDFAHSRISNQNYDQETYVKFRNKLATYPVGQDFCLDDIPWKSGDKSYELGVFGLQEEIKDFFEYIKPTPEEQFAREVVVWKIKQVVHCMWPHCQVDVFGSFKTGLYLPTSDVDMVILGKWDALPLRTLEKALSRSGISSELKVLDKASVPIVKMTDKETGLRVDISFNMMNSVLAAVMVQEYMRDYPYLPYLVFVLKQFLLQRCLNEVWTGGLSSYALILMVVRFLQQTVPQNGSLSKVNLGTLLLEFFELYGRHFNYSKTAIRVADGGEYVRKELVLQNMVHSVRPSILCIEDPLCPGNDVGRRSYQALLVKEAFAYAYVVLSSAVLPQYRSLHGHKDISILGRIIRISKETVACRQRIHSLGRRLLATNWLNAGLPYTPLMYTNAGAVSIALQGPLTAPSSHSLPVTSEFQPPLMQTAFTPQRSSSGGLENGPKTEPPSSETRQSMTKSSPVRDLGYEDAIGTKAQENPGECTVLAEDFASLMGSEHTELQDIEGHNCATASVCNLEQEDCKRRCLRSQLPLNVEHSKTHEAPRYISDLITDSVADKLDNIPPTTGGANTSKPMESNSSATVFIPGRSRKQTAASTRQQPVHSSSGVLGSQFACYNNSTSNVSFTQRRHATASRRSK